MKKKPHIKEKQNDSDVLVYTRYGNTHKLSKLWNEKSCYQATVKSPLRFGNLVFIVTTAHYTKKVTSLSLLLLLNIMQETQASPLVFKINFSPLGVILSCRAAPLLLCFVLYGQNSERNLRLTQTLFHFRNHYRLISFC